MITKITTRLQALRGFTELQSSQVKDITKITKITRVTGVTDITGITNITKNTGITKDNTSYKDYMRLLKSQLASVVCGLELLQQIH